MVVVRARALSLPPGRLAAAVQDDGPLRGGVLQLEYLHIVWNALLLLRMLPESKS